MRKIFTTLIFVCAFTLMTTAHAENWVYATVNAYGTWYVDTHSVIIEKNSDGEFIFYALVKQELSATSRENPREC